MLSPTLNTQLDGLHRQMLLPEWPHNTLEQFQKLCIDVSKHTQDDPAFSKPTCVPHIRPQVPPVQVPPAPFKPSLFYPTHDFSLVLVPLFVGTVLCIPQHHHGSCKAVRCPFPPSHTTRLSRKSHIINISLPGQIPYRRYLWHCRDMLHPGWLTSLAVERFRS